MTSYSDQFISILGYLAQKEINKDSYLEIKDVFICRNHLIDLFKNTKEMTQIKTNIGINMNVLTSEINELLDNIYLFTLFEIERRQNKSLYTIQKEGHELFKKKNSDYGNSFEVFGFIGIIIRTIDKLNRLEQLLSNNEKKVLDENIEDTLIDLHNYIILAKICIV